MSNYSTIYKLLKTIDNSDNTTTTTGINPFSSTMYNNGVTYYNSTTNKVLTDPSLIFESTTLTTPNLNSTTSITTPNLTTTTGISTPTLNATTSITTPTLTTTTAINTPTLNATSSITTPNITTSGLTILNNDINITGISSSSTRKLKIVGTTSHNLGFSFDFGNFLPAETGNKSFDFYKYSFTAGECTLCIYNPDNAGTTIRHKLSANSGKNSFLCNDSTSQLVVGSGTSTSNYALLQLQSTTKGLLLPRLTDTQITTLQSGCTSTETGLTIYDTTNTALKIFNGSSFQPVGSSSVFTYPVWSAETVNTITGVSTSPTKGTTTSDFIIYRLLNATEKEYEVMGRIVTTVSSSNGGSGDYLFTLPNSLTFSTTKGQQALNTEAGGLSLKNALLHSNGVGSFPAQSTSTQLQVVPYNSTKFRLHCVAFSSHMSSSTFAFNNASVPSIIYFNFRFFAV